MNLLEVIKSAGMQAVDASYPVQISLGTVESINPISVRVDQQTVLPKEFLIVPERLTRYEIDLTHTHQYQDRNGSIDSTRTTEQSLYPIVIRAGLQVGESVILLRVQGGNDFIILDKVVTGT